MSEHEHRTGANSYIVNGRLSQGKELWKEFDRFGHYHVDDPCWRGSYRVSNVSRGRFEASIFCGFCLASFMGSSEAWRWVYVIYILGDGGS